MVRSVGTLDDEPILHSALERVREQEKEMLGPNDRHRASSNPKGYILCRICEAVVPADIMIEHKAVHTLEALRKRRGGCRLCTFKPGAFVIGSCNHSTWKVLEEIKAHEAL